MEMEVSYNNFSRICRICLVSEDLRPFTGPGILNTFQTITKINITKEDDLPKNICSNCVGELTNIEHFIEQCTSNDSKLRSIALEKNVITDIKPEFDCDTAAVISSNENQDKIIVKIEALKVSHKESISDSGLKQTQCKENGASHSVSGNRCSICGSCFNSKSSLSRHFKENSKCRSKVKCDVCQREFTTHRRKEEHMNLHTGITPYICSYCGQNFKISATYRKHIYQHREALGEVPKRKKYIEKRVRLKLKCNMCDNKIFSSRYGYAYHLLTKHGIGPGSKGAAGRHKQGERRFLCNHCAKSFHTKSLLEIHLRVHTDERPFECKECGKCFKQGGTLRLHKLNHLESRPKPFKCDVCGKSFTQKCHCEVHKRTHTGEKPYSCNFCGKSFNYKTYWKTHLRMHTGEMPFSCPICHQKYHDKSSLSKHQKKKQHIVTEKDF